jgi:dTDP-D-glucose 4,6-dehydratase
MISLQTERDSLVDRSVTVSSGFIWTNMLGCCLRLVA